MRLVSFAFAGVEPEIMGIGPVPSTEKALRKAGLSIDEIGLFELNEAFAVQVLSLLDHFGIDDDDPRVNPWGGAIAIGHPLASSGVRLMIQLARAVRGASRRALRLDRHVRRARPGRLGHLGEPALHGRANDHGDEHRLRIALAGRRDEVVTHSYVRDVALPGGKTLALITLDNGRDHTRPNTLGPATLIELAGVLDELAERAGTRRDRRGRDHRQAVHPRRRRRPQQGQRNPEPRDRAADGPARARGVSASSANSACHRSSSSTASPSAAAWKSPSTPTTAPSTARRPPSALPEVFLGLVPGWGGAWLLPNLIGIENALKVVIENPLKNNRMLGGKQAFELGIADAMFPPVTFLEDSIRWADGVLTGKIKVTRRTSPARSSAPSSGTRRSASPGRCWRAGSAPSRNPRIAALELLKAAKNTDKETGFAREDEALADLIAGDQLAREHLRVQPGAEAREASGRRAGQGARAARSRRSASSAPGSWPASSRCCSSVGSRFPW